MLAVGVGAAAFGVTPKEMLNVSDRSDPKFAVTAQVTWVPTTVPCLFLYCVTVVPLTAAEEGQFTLIVSCAQSGAAANTAVRSPNLQKKPFKDIIISSEIPLANPKGWRLLLR
jgi:hypothetical protein